MKWLVIFLQRHNRRFRCFIHAFVIIQSEDEKSEDEKNVVVDTYRELLQGWIEKADDYAHQVTLKRLLENFENSISNKNVRGLYKAIEFITKPRRK